MMKLKKVSYIIITLMLTAALTACQQSGLLTNSEGETGTYITSEKISIAAVKIRNINPATSLDDDVYQMTKLVYNSLIRLGDTLEPVNELAESWSYNDSGDIEFTLKKGVKFSDGSELTADDVEFTVRALQAAGADSVYASKVDHISGVSVKNDYELTMRLQDPSDTSIADFNFPIFSASQFSGTKALVSNTEEPLIGTGRYKIDSVSLNQSIELSANEYTFETKPQNTISIEIMPVEDPYPGLVSAGDLSIVIMDQFNRENISGDKKLKVTQFTSSEFETLGFNCAGGCSDKNIRQAIAMTVNRDDIISSAYYTSGIKSDDLYFPGYLGTETTNDFSPDKAQALALLEKSGYTDRDSDGFVEDEEGNVLSLRLVTSSENESRKMAAQMITMQLADIGISVAVTEVPAESLSDAVYSGAYDMFIAGWQADERYDLRQFYHSGYNNPAKYVNAEVDALLDEMVSGISADKMKSTISEAKKIIAEDIPYLCLCYKTYAAVTSSGFEGLIASRFNDYYYGCEDWNVKFFQKVEETENSEAEEADTD